MRKSWLLLFIFIFVFLAACGPAGGATPPATEEQSSQDTGLITTESGLQYEILEEGAGDKPTVGSRVSVHYTGSLEDGTVFDSSTGGDPFTFTLGTGSVIPGWDEGIALLNEGSKARLVIPPELGYGSTGAGDTIPPDSTLIFEVELVEVFPGGPAEPTKVDADDFTTTESGLQYYDFEVGDADAMPAEGQPVRIHYTIWLEDGTRLDSSIDRGEPLTFAMGQDQLFPGWEEGVSTMGVGGKRQLIVPPELAYGEASPGGAIPANATFIIEVELVELLESGPASPPEVADEDFQETESGLRYFDVEAGDGPAVEDGQTVNVHYTGWLEDGTLFDSSYSRGTPIPYVIGSGGAIPGWEEGISTMNIGGKRLLVIPPELGYGEDGYGDLIPPGATLTFLVELVEGER